MRELTFSKGQKIFKEGDSSEDGVYLVRSGKVEISKKQNAVDVTLAILEKDAIFGEMSLLCGHPRSATATALADTTCMAVSPEEFSQQLNDINPFMRGIFRIVVNTTQEITQKYIELQSSINKIF